jgi:hypothetical protein
MKPVKLTIFFFFFVLSSLLFPQEQRKVLVEVFTNSHCPLCPPAHNIIEDYIENSSNGNKISYIFYHMVYPYSDDWLYYDSMEGSDARNTYYDPVAATPQGWFDGVHQGSYNGWAATLDALTQTESPLRIILSGSRNSSQVFLNAQLTRTGNISDNDLVIRFLVVEDLFYDGRNSISDHKHVMRKMLPTPSGLPFSIGLNETKDIEQTINIESIWDADSLSFVVFVQSTSSKTVYQSETISYEELMITNTENEETGITGFSLEQNFPNPFNPITKIRFTIPSTRFITLKIYNILGNDVATLVNEMKPAGEYEVEFDASSIPSGVYFYQLKSGSNIETKKMLLIK